MKAQDHFMKVRKWSLMLLKGMFLLPPTKGTGLKVLLPEQML